MHSPMYQTSTLCSLPLADQHSDEHFKNVMKSLVFILCAIKVIIILCANCTNRVMAFPTLGASGLQTTIPTPRQLYELSRLLFQDADAICQRFELYRLEGDVPVGQRCRDPLSTVHSIPATTLVVMEPSSLLKTLQTNLARFSEPLQRMRMREMSWQGLHRFYLSPSNQRGFEHLEDDVLYLLGNTTVRLTLEDSTSSIIAREIVASVPYSPDDASLVATDWANHQLLRLLTRVSRQLRIVAMTHLRMSALSPS